MENIFIIGKKINRLKNIFFTYNDKFIYNSRTQEKVNLLLDEICKLSGVYDTSAKKEKENILQELSFIDTTTGEKINLVNIDSMKKRTESVLEQNNLFSCLKALAVSNKCAHIFDGDIESTTEDIGKYYKLLYQQPFDKDNFSFMLNFDLFFPKIPGNLFGLKDISDYDFNKLYQSITSNKKIKKGNKISILKSLGINFDIKSDIGINNKFEELKRNKDLLLYSYLKNKYEYGKHLLDLQNKMFSIKDCYISMIGQLLLNDKRFQNIKYELVKCPTKPGFDYMLIVDDVELSYYIEVHMPNYIAHSLMSEYGMKLTPERTTTHASATAVYPRDRKEIHHILEAMDTSKIPSGARAKVITRGFSLNDGGVEPESEKDTAIKQEKRVEEKIPESYEFLTDVIDDESLLIEDFLLEDQKHLKFVQFNQLLRNNENYPISYIHDTIMSNYKALYSSFKDDYKAKFVNYSLYRLQEGDSFDKVLLDTIIEKELDYNLVGNILLSLSRLKKDFISYINNTDLKDFYYKNMNSDKLSNYDIKYFIKSEMKEYINEYVDDELRKVKKSGRR